MVKDPLVFHEVLAAFVAWAKGSDHSDLTFMIPMHDREAKEIFMNYLQNSSYIYDCKLITFAIIPKLE